MFTTQLILSQWEPVTECYLLVRWADTPWKHGSFPSPRQVYELPRLSPVRCHLGKSIVYDTVTNASWVVDIRTHGIVSVIERLLSDPWPASVEVGREVPEATVELDCLVSLDYVPYAPIIGCLFFGLGLL